jgi:hypothetical protein
MPLEIETYMPITRTTIAAQAHEKWTISSKREKEQLVAILRGGIKDKASLDENRVRMLIVLDRNSYFVDVNGVVHKDGSEDSRLDQTGLYRLRNSLRPRERHILIKDIVADAATALKIGEPALIKNYGKKQIDYERPLNAKLEDGIWTVYGTLCCPDRNGRRTCEEGKCLGGVALLKLRQSDGKILSITHYK